MTQLQLQVQTHLLQQGIASFSSDNFAVSSGAVTIKNGGVNNDELAGSIANAKLANSTITVAGGSGSTAIDLR